MSNGLMDCYFKNTLKKYLLQLVLVLLVFCYFVMALIPKHADFWLLNYQSAPFWINPLNFYHEINAVTAIWPPVYPPTIYAIQGAWIGLSGPLFNMNITGVYQVEGASLGIYSLWAIIPIIVALSIFVYAAYSILDNKWLTILCFATFTFVSVIIMGQSDIFPVLLIFISLILIQRAFYSENYYVLFFLGFLALGISMQFKTYGGLLLPAYLIYTLAVAKVKKIDLVNTLLLLTACGALFLIAMFIVWVPYDGLFQKVILGGKSNFLLQNSLFNGLSLWLLGYTIIIYYIIQNIFDNPEKFIKNKKYFVFFNFVIISWFFISVNTNPQWWLLLLPFVLLVLDNFKNRSGFIVCGLIMVLFLLFPMMSRFTIADNLILLNMPVVFLNSIQSAILFTCLAGLLLIWIFELHKELIGK